MNQPPDWGDLAAKIGEQDRPDFRVLIITNSLQIINAVVIPAMMKRLPRMTSINYIQLSAHLPLGAMVLWRSVASPSGFDRLRGLTFDSIFFDPVWQGTAKQMEAINDMCRRKDNASR